MAGPATMLWASGSPELSAWWARPSGLAGGNSIISNPMWVPGLLTIQLPDGCLCLDSLWSFTARMLTLLVHHRSEEERADLWSPFSAWRLTVTPAAWGPRLRPCCPWSAQVRTQLVHLPPLSHHCPVLRGPQWAQTFHPVCGSPSHGGGQHSACYSLWQETGVST